MDSKFNVAVITTQMLCFLHPFSSWASIDAPGKLSFEWVVVEQGSCEEDELTTGNGQVIEVDAFFSSDASSFGQGGVLLWAGFSYLVLEEERHGVLLIDVDLSKAPLGGQEGVPYAALRTEFVEKKGEQVLFEGVAVEGMVWILDVVFDLGDKGAIEGDMNFVFLDERTGGESCRVILQGHFITVPAPSALRSKYPISSERNFYNEGDTLVGIYIESEGCDCGGYHDDTGSGGCEGDVSASSGSYGGDSEGCEGDSLDSGVEGGCAGDSSGSGYGGGAEGCEGDEISEDGQDCSHVHGGPFRMGARAGVHWISRFFPEIVGLIFVFWMKRRSS